MIEKVSQAVGKKLTEMGSLWPQGTDGLLLADDPRLHREIKKRIQKKLNIYGESPDTFDIETTLPSWLTAFLIEEVELQRTDFLLANEKLNRSVFEKILKNLGHLDFRSFASAQRAEFALYDPEVITPQVSWAIEQVFQNLPGFFKLFDEQVQQGQFLEEEQTNITRNIFILGYLHGFLNEGAVNLDSTKLFLAHALKKSNATLKKWRDYPELLTRLVEDNSHLVSPRLEQLKAHWHQQLARRWVMMSRVDEASADALGPATRIQAEKNLPQDRRLTENVAVARKMDRFAKIKNVFQGISSEQTQLQAELNLSMDVVQIQQSTIFHMRDILRLYQDDDQEVFHDGYQTAEKWIAYQASAEAVLQKLVAGFATLNEVKGDANKFNTALDTVVTAMIQSLGNAGEQTTLKSLFGEDFFGLAKIEQVALLAFTALSFVTRETTTSKLAVQILDSLVVPHLNQHSDLDNSEEIKLDATTFDFSAFDQERFAAKSKQAKLTLNNLKPSDELMSTDSEQFIKIFKEQHNLLSGVAWIHSFFAKLTTENFRDRPKLAGSITTAIFLASAAISGSLNFYLSQDLLTESLSDIFSKDVPFFLCEMLAIVFTLASGGLAAGDGVRRNFKKLSLSAKELQKDLQKFSKGGWRQAVSLLFLSTYAAASTYPILEKVTQEAWNEVKERWEEYQNGDTSQTQDATIRAWEDRSPEARDVKDLAELEKVDWGEVAIGGEMYGQLPTYPIGFVNSYTVSPIATLDQIQSYQNDVEPMSYDYAQSKGIIVNAVSYVKKGDDLVFTLANGETFVQSASGTDFVIKNGLATEEYGFLKLLDTGRYIDKIIAIPASNNSEGNLFVTNESYRDYDSPNDYSHIVPDTRYEYFVVYKTDQNVVNRMESSSIHFEENLVYWQARAEDRKIIQAVLEKENPAAAALYAEMLLEQELFWENFDATQHQEGDYLAMVQRQIDAYSNFVQTNDVYSLQYDPQTDYVSQYPNVGVMLDVMSLKKGGYYCLTAHLAAQEWFLSLGVPMSGLHGFSIYDDEGTARSRVTHVKTGVYGAVFDFTPATPNPGEDLSALAFDENTGVEGTGNIQKPNGQEAIADWLKNLASVESLAGLVILLSLTGAGYSIKLGLEEFLRSRSPKNRADEIERIKIMLPDNELEMRGLSMALLQLLNFVTDPSQTTFNKEAILQAVTESLVLATTPAHTQTQRARSLPLNPDAAALLELVGLKDRPSESASEVKLEKILEKFNSNPTETNVIMREISTSLETSAAEMRKTSQLKVETANRSVRKLQRQLGRMKRKENRIYGMYGKILETTPFIQDEKINELRQSITTNYLTLRHELERQTKELQEYTSRAKLLPANAKNLKKIFDFIVANNSEITHA